MFNLDTIVTMRPDLQDFHYTQSPFMSLEPILKKLRHGKTTGLIKKMDTENHAIGELFPRMNTILWFKTYELQTNGRH